MKSRISLQSKKLTSSRLSHSKEKDSAELLSPSVKLSNHHNKNGDQSPKFLDSEGSQSKKLSRKITISLSTKKEQSRNDPLSLNKEMTIPVENFRGETLEVHKKNSIFYD